ncbi:MAG: ribosomal protein S18-alanine N-acetyltransferase [Zhaonellaceae bacterium]|jgi:ribosomal-protein-alanine N-acetyltransferase|nr:ribosomal protein S18-alanine N-acetyltransferase [Clostridia bacterium]
MDKVFKEGKYKITPMNVSHINEVAQIEQVSFPTPWSKEAYYNELKDNGFAHYYVCLACEQVVGYAGMWIIIDEAHITNIAVHPDFRGQKIAQTLLLKLMQEAMRLGAERITLEVRSSNRVAQYVYGKLGFYPVGIRKGYYTDTKEDAIIMWKNLYES